MFAAASNALAQAAAVDQAVKDEAVVADKMRPEAALTRTDILLISINNSLSNIRAPSKT